MSRGGLIMPLQQVAVTYSTNLNIVFSKHTIINKHTITIIFWGTAHPGHLKIYLKIEFYKWTHEKNSIYIYDILYSFLSKYNKAGSSNLLL